jgi:hypothetical protein
MYSIFAPLDPDERVPREAQPENRLGLQLYRVDVDRRKLSRLELAGVVVFPALFLLLAILGHEQASGALTLGAVFLLLVGLAAFAFSGRHR